MPILTVFAGPNGSGKSSIISGLAFAGRDNLLEADAIARRIRPDQPRSAAVAAGREVLRRTQKYLDSGQDFAIETTLSGTWTSVAIKQALARAFFVRLVYICLENPEHCIRRVRERVAQGGHDVPNEDVRRRYVRGLLNLQELLRVTHESLIYDNSGLEPKLIFELRSGVTTYKSGAIPDWARCLLRTGH